MQDQLWKQIIEALFPDFVRFFMPDLAQEVNFERPYSFLDQELQALSPQAEQGQRRVDRLVKVFLNSGPEQWVLIHAEVQGYYDLNFSRRMFVYFYRIFDKYSQKIAAIAIFADQSKSWKPDTFAYDFAQTALQYKYPVYKILDQSEAELKASENPFALVTLAALYAMRCRRKADSVQMRFKLELIELLFQKGYDSTRIRAVLHFVDPLIKLKSEESQLQFTEEVKKMASTQEHVEILGDLEEVMMREGLKKGLKKGLEKGLQQGLQQGLEKGLQQSQHETAIKMKADGMAAELIAKYSGLSLAEIARL